MKTRTMGRTGFEVSELVLGAGWVGGLFLHKDQETMLRTLELALDAGINWIDTAENYGNGESELNLGAVLRQLDAARRPMMSTKVAIDMASNESIGSQVDRAIDASLSRLGLDRVELYQLHNPVRAEPDGRHISPAEVLRNDGVAETLHRIRDDGRTGAIGLTALGDVDPLLEIIDTGLFDTAQVYYNMLNPSAALPAGADWAGHRFCGLLECCAAHDMGTMNIRVMAAGVLASDERHGREVPVIADTDLDLEGRQARLLADELGSAHGTRAQVAVRYALAARHISCIVLGLAETEHLELALEAVERGPLSEEALDRVRHTQETRFATA